MGMYSDTMCHGQRDHQASPMERRHEAAPSACAAPRKAKALLKAVEGYGWMI